jgi:hypothetical protein
MSEKQNSRLDKDGSSQVDDEQSGVRDGPSPKNYYYDDSTGYEIYHEEKDDDDEEETS